MIMHTNCLLKCVNEAFHQSVVLSDLFVFNVCAFFFMCFPRQYESRFFDPPCKPLLYLDICVSLVFILPNWL